MGDKGLEELLAENLSWQLSTSVILVVGLRYEYSMSINILFNWI